MKFFSSVVLPVIVLAGAFCLAIEPAARCLKKELPLRHFVLSSAALIMLFGGFSIGVASLAPATLDFLNESKVLAGPVVDSSSFTAQSGCAVLGGKKLKSTNGSIANMIQYISLGSIGEISLREMNITRNSYTPEVLRFSITDGKDGAEMIPDDSRPLRKVSDGTPDGSYMAQPLRQVAAG
jgi:hypothetical protein